MSLHMVEVVLVGWVIHAGLLHRRVERAGRDPLTGLHTRVGWMRRARRAVRDPTGAAVVMIDLDRFKALNDTYGHQTGDVVLTAMGRRLIDWCRHGEPAGRLGGDEFIAVVTGPHVEARIRTLRAVLGEPVPEAPVGVSASIGYALAGGLGTDLSTLMEAADQAMYATKTGTGNPPWTPYSPDDQSLSLGSETGRRSLLRTVLEVWTCPAAVSPGSSDHTC